MPGKRKYRRRRKRSDRKTRKRTARSSRNTIVNVRRTPIAKKAVIKMRYVDDFQIDPTIGLIGVHHFIANGLYDPDITGVGHQPHGFDQWMTFYNHYTVVGAKITARFSTNTSTNGNASWCGVAVLPTTSAYTANTTLMRENGMGTWTRLSGANPSVRSVTRYFSAKKFFGMKNIVGLSEYRGNETSNPSEGAFFSVMVGSIAGNDPLPVNCSVTIDYIVVLTEPKAIGQS